MQELCDAVRRLLDWMPICSVGSSGYKCREDVERAMHAAQIQSQTARKMSQLRSDGYDGVSRESLLAEGQSQNAAPPTANCICEAGYASTCPLHGDPSKCVSVTPEQEREDFQWLQEISNALSSSRTRPDDLESMLDEIRHLHADLREFRNLQVIEASLRQKLEGHAQNAAPQMIQRLIKLAHQAREDEGSSSHSNTLRDLRTAALLIELAKGESQNAAPQPCRHVFSKQSGCCLRCDAPEPEASPILTAQLYRALERLHLAVKGCARIGFEESSPTKNAHHASIWNDLNEAQKDARLKLKHFKEMAEGHAQAPAPPPDEVKRLTELVNQKSNTITRLCIAARELLDWMPICSKGSSGWLCRVKMEEAIAPPSAGTQPASTQKCTCRDETTYDDPTCAYHSQHLTIGKISPAPLPSVAQDKER